MTKTYPRVFVLILMMLTTFCLAMPWVQVGMMSYMSWVRTFGHVCH